ncbi:hypothetical protein [Candidatus Mycobacterium methanotrophicum]|uniref:Secreted protein n=1 Tax=Candidatus Mycobacterium methanotrophicum TaxID=2943498 RepID=A0ABY4QLZ7_9MYCO|nr:hypothetical protein [Candidatus Mycobacterium methanotrophicum]UQX10881.1 hypothetical protein M5I08_23545 [Candidatus Mycobacterium methanotrophicum]
MFRELAIAAAIAGAAIGMAPTAASDPTRYDGDVPGIDYGAHLSGPCDSYERYVFGRGPGGEALACHAIPNQFFPTQSVADAYWVISYPLYGVQQAGAPCPGPQSAAQSPDGLEMLCFGARGWQPGRLIGSGAPLPGSPAEVIPVG